jgi:hypothetical protein
MRNAPYKATVHEDYRREVGASGPSDRAFGLVFACFFLLVGLWPLARQGGPRLWALGAGSFFGLVAVFCPTILSSANRFWTSLGLLLARIVNPLVTGVMFFLVFTPMALLMKLLGQDHLRLRYEPRADSYWLPRQPPGPPPETMTNQF